MILNYTYSEYFGCDLLVYIEHTQFSLWLECCFGSFLFGSFLLIFKKLRRCTENCFDCGTIKTKYRILTRLKDNNIKRKWEKRRRHIHEIVWESYTIHIACIHGLNTSDRKHTSLASDSRSLFFFSILTLLPFSFISSSRQKRFSFRFVSFHFEKLTNFNSPNDKSLFNNEWSKRMKTRKKNEWTNEQYR